MHFYRPLLSCNNTPLFWLPRLFCLQKSWEQFRRIRGYIILIAWQWISRALGNSAFQTTCHNIMNNFSLFLSVPPGWRSDGTLTGAHPLPYKSFPIHYTPVILPFDALQSKLLTMLLQKSYKIIASHSSLSSYRHLLPLSLGKLLNFYNSHKKSIVTHISLSLQHDQVTHTHFF
jgi:hypothetical protein